MSTASRKKRGPIHTPPKQVGLIHIDGQPAERDEVRRLLDASGNFRVVEPESIAELDELLETGAFDIVLCELKAWGLRELQVLERVRALGSQARVVILT